jgi:gustatory receptor
MLDKHRTNSHSLYSAMDSKLLGLIVTFGKIFAITPSRNQAKKLKSKIYGLVVITVLITASTVSVLYYRQPLYVSFTEVKLFVSISMSLIVNFFNCYTVLAPVFCKEKQYCKLMKKLEDNVEMDKTWGKRVSLYLWFVLPNVIYLLVSFYVVSVWSDILGFEYYGEYFVEVVQLYFQFYYNYFLCVIVKIFLNRYKYVNFLLSEQLIYVKIRKTISTKEYPISIGRIEDLICGLKELNVIFNDIFGWPILMIILYSSLLMLNYLEEIFQNNFGYDNGQFLGVIISNISVAVVTSVSEIWIISFVLLVALLLLTF